MFKNRSFYWALTILIIVSIIFLAGWESIKDVFLPTNPFILLLLCLFQVFTLSLTAYRWYYLLKKFYKGIGFREFFAIYLIGNFVESVTPSSKFGGELTRAYFFRQRTLLSYQKITAILLLDKFLTLLPFLFISTVLLVVTAFKVELPIVVYISFLFLALVLTVLYRFYLPRELEVGSGRACPCVPGTLRIISFFFSAFASASAFVF